MKRTKTIVADDGDVRVTMKLDVLSRNGLTRDEVGRIIRALVRGAAPVLGTLPYSDLGVENTVVR